LFIIGYERWGCVDASVPTEQAGYTSQQIFNVGCEFFIFFKLIAYLRIATRLSFNPSALYLAHRIYYSKTEVFI